MVFSENGLIQKAQEAKDVQLIATYQDRIEIVCLNWSLDKSLNDEIGIDNLWERMKDEGIILDIERDVEKLDDEGNYVITVPEGYKFQIHIDENGDAEIEYIGKDDALLPYIQSIEVISKTTSSVNVEVTVTREGENLRLSYYYKKLDDPEENYIAIKENVADKTAEVTGLESETIYNLKVIAQNENGESQKVVELTVEGIIGADEGLREGAIIASEPTWDSNSHTASITLSKGEGVGSNLSIEWQINSINTDGWTTGESVTGLNHNDTVYARLTDGVNHGQEGSVTIKDGTPPTVTVNQGTITTNSIAVNVSSKDDQWGMPTSPTYNYYIKESAAGSYPTSPNYTGTNTSYTFTGLTQGTSYDIRVTTTDRAGNEGTGTLANQTTGTVGGATGGLIEGNIIASSPTWSNNTASITLSKGSSVASNLSIQWQINSIDAGGWTTGTSVTGLNHNDTVYARLTDGINAGSEASVTIKDGTAPSAPTISLSGTPGNNNYYRSNVTVTIAAGSDGQSGANQVRYSVSGAQTVSQTTTAAGTTTASITITAEGTSTITAYTIDKAGNISTAKTQVVCKDSTAPSTASLTVGTVGETSIAVTASGADATSGVYSYQFQRSTTSSTSGFTTIASQTSTATSYSYTYTGLTDGITYYLRVIVTDRAGNATTSIAVVQKTKETLKADGSFNSSKGVNTPDLVDGKLTPIKWNGSSWVETTADDSSWYSYSTSSKQWANAKTSDGSMWVWIPRFAYQISSGYHSSSAGTINIKFMNGTGNTAADGSSSWSNKSGSGNWNIHPAFEYNGTKAGIWVAKFEASRSNATSSSTGSRSTMKIQPGVQSWRSISVSDIFDTCKSYNSSLNSHMMKNSEWGAIAYLSKSSYGINREITINNNSSYLTGGESENAYTSNTSQSTTGTVYGIYDINGGSYELVAAYVNNEVGNLNYYGSSLVSAASYMKDVYNKGSSDDPIPNYAANSDTFGDAVYETSLSVSLYYTDSWYTDFSHFPSSDAPFFIRGGSYGNGSHAGAFCFNETNGAANISVGFRPVLTP